MDPIQSKTPNNPIHPINKDWFHRHKLFLATLVIVIIGAGLILQWKMDYFRSQINTDFPIHHAKKIDTSNWKTYSNSKYSYEFRYPEDHTVFSDIENDRFVLATTDSDKVAVVEDEKLVFCCEAEGYHIQAHSTPLLNPKGKLITYVNTLAYERGGGDCRIDAQFSILDIPVNGGYLTITQDCNTDVLDSIASTFKFKDPASNQNLKTYINNKYNYSISYPADWKLVIPQQNPPVPEDEAYGFALANFDLPQTYMIYSLDPGQIFISGGAFPTEIAAGCQKKAADYINGEEITVAGVKGVRYNTADQPQSMEGEGSMDAISVEFSKNNICYGLGFSPISASQELQKKFNDLVASFKFIK